MTPRPLRIAVMAHCRHPVAAPFMGGMEAHAHHLAHALQARGHDVTLVAAGDSRARVAVMPLMAQHYDRDYPWHQWHGTAALNAHLDDRHADALQAMAGMGFDVIHNNTLHRYPPRLSRQARVPMVTSLHVPPFDALRRAIRDSGAPWHRVTGCSDSHLAAYYPDGPPPWAHVVPNGIDLADWPFSPQGDGRAVWAGRITPNKAPHLAIAAARRAGVGLTLFGAIEDGDYFATHIRPLLAGDIRFGGHLAAADLAVEYGRASALLFTPQWDEPFGLTAIEAMACGTPVAAIAMGAAASVIGPAGRLAAADGAGLDRALRDAMAIPRTLPRARVEAHFTLTRMIAAHEGLYAQAIAGRDAPFPAVDFAAIELPPALTREMARPGAT
ncbi:glycosyltransferase [Paracoccus hibiscisoli]|uniref:glycosyltransferase n=1 Tax=Paracoccus hibiscisoli TaxID=2023261 RepID=UPI001B7FB21B|nr:glycosyltransferase [Paracoccus hibiscisoli]